MCALDARPDAVQIGRVRVRGPADALCARRRLEASVADLSPAALGLPPRAVLVVRRVEPSARLPMGRSARTDGFGRAVRDALR
ncbi:MAG TPA: hypothetical protein VFT45_06160, partial [Longimicrobium sp.]|nr:hypothetical protein [Longimicrobium sp.]